MNTKIGSSIEIANRYSITLAAIHHNGDTTFDVNDNSHEDQAFTFSLKQGKKIEVLPEVFMLVGRIRQSEQLATEAVLLFEAPKSIRIRGNWYKQGKNRYGGANEATMRNLTDKEFLNHTKELIQGPIEYGLWERFSKALDSIALSHERAALSDSKPARR